VQQKNVKKLWQKLPKNNKILAKIATPFGVIFIKNDIKPNYLSEIK
jgi:uncharacterized protein (UPF0128 family)